MGSLKTEDEIELWTQNGACRIQLLSGDITTLPVEEKVDIIMVSAFSDEIKMGYIPKTNNMIMFPSPEPYTDRSGDSDYAPISSTVIGALKNKLGISVRDLAYNKEQDLRYHFSCWLSTIKTDNSPFKKVLCFERKHNMLATEQVSQMFRVFVPVFNNQDNTVITPLLTAGNQGCNELTICETMVKAAAYWINAGLPLRCFKIVIFRESSQEIRDMFKTMKKKLLAKNWKLKNRITRKLYDICVLFHPEDESKYVSQIVDNFRKNHSGIKVFATATKYDHNAVWQTNIFNALVTSKRIIVVLTVRFQDSAECLEQYNMAICCNKMMGGNVLVPFYMEIIQSLPTYMTLVQWIDCRERKAGDTTVGKIQSACSNVLHTLTMDALDVESTVEAKPDKFQFDVFISYSHKNPKEAELLLNVFNEVDGSINVFYDRNALTSGINWQEMLYKCMGKCKCAIALMSTSYLTSTVCMEEYNLALARFLSQDKGMQFLPIWIEKPDIVPVHVTGVSILDAVGKFDEKAYGIATSISKWLKGSLSTPDTSLFPSVTSQYRHDTEATVEEEDTAMEKLFSLQRSLAIEDQYRFKMNKKVKAGIERLRPLVIPKIELFSGSDVKEVVFSFSNDSSYLAHIFCSILDQKYPNIKINLTMGQSMERMESLDTASMVVVFISKEYIQNDSHIDELYLALMRQRSSDNKHLYLIKASAVRESSMFFPMILNYDLAITDSIWRRFETEYVREKYTTEERKMVVRRTRNIPGQPNFQTCRPSEYFALTKAADDMIEMVLNLSDRTIPYKPMLQNLVAVEMEVTGSINNSNFNKDCESTGFSHTGKDPTDSNKVMDQENNHETTLKCGTTLGGHSANGAQHVVDELNNTSASENMRKLEDMPYAEGQNQMGNSETLPENEIRPLESDNGIIKTKVPENTSMNTNKLGKEHQGVVTEEKTQNGGIKKGSSRSCHLL